MKIIKVISADHRDTEKQINSYIQDGYKINILFQNISTTGEYNYNITVITTLELIAKKKI